MNRCTPGGLKVALDVGLRVRAHGVIRGHLRIIQQRLEHLMHRVAPGTKLERAPVGDHVRGHDAAFRD